MIKKPNKILYCTICGTTTTINKKVVKLEKDDSKRKNSSYQAIKHFEIVFTNIFI